MRRDSVVGRVYSLKYFFFPESGTADVSTVIDTLRHGVSKTLEAIPLLSGTVQVIDRGALCIAGPWSAVNDIFRVKDLRQEGQLEYQTLRDKQFPLSVLDDRLLASLGGDREPNEKISPPSSGTMKSEKPVMFVQLNIIRGGIIIALCVSHSFTDGNGIPTITRVLGAYCRGDDGSRLITPEMIDRKRLMRGRGGTTLADFREFGIDSVAAIKKPEGSIQQEFEIGIIFFPKGRLAELKSMAFAKENGEFGDRWISTIDALSALLGCCIGSVRDKETRARVDRNWVIRSVLGGRRTLDPPLPEGYIGNVLSFTRIPIPYPSIDSTLAKVVESAHLMRDQIKQRDEAYFQGVIGALSRVKDLGKVKTASLSPSEDGMFITSWANQGFYEIDWGDVVGGRTERVRKNRFRFGHRPICWIMPELSAPYFPDDECWLEVIVNGLDKDEMARLKENELFMRFGQWKSN